jgi:hypothetical protein
MNDRVPKIGTLRGDVEVERRWPQSIARTSGVNLNSTNLSVCYNRDPANSQRGDTELRDCSKIETPPDECRGGWFVDSAPRAWNFEKPITPFERAEFICLEREAARRGSELRTS